MREPSLDVAGAVAVYNDGLVLMVSFRISNPDPTGIVNLNFETCEELIKSIREAMKDAEEIARHNGAPQ